MPDKPVLTGNKGFPLTSTHNYTPRDLDPNRDPWEKQSIESPKSWLAFKEYRDQGVTRSLRQTTQAVGKSMTLIERWSVQHRWVARAKAWDEYLEEQGRQAAVQAVIDMQTRHINLATMAQNAVALRLRNLGGSTGDYSDLPASVLASLLKVGADLERISRGEVVTRVGVQHSGGVKVSSLGRRIMDNPQATAAALDLLEQLAAGDDMIEDDDIQDDVVEEVTDDE